MTSDRGTRSLLTTSLGVFRSSWKPLILTSIAFRLIAFIALTPLVTLLFRGLLAVSGNSVVSDQDILHFFLGPPGWCCLILVGAIALGIVALEQAALMAVIHAASENRPIGATAALQFAAANAWPVIRLAARVIFRTVLVAVPFLAALGARLFHAAQPIRHQLLPEGEAARLFRCGRNRRDHRRCHDRGASPAFFRLVLRLAVGDL